MQGGEEEDRRHASYRLRQLGASDLAERLDELMATRGQEPRLDEQHALLLDLQIHQIELEMQARELREAQRQLELSRDRYARLFDLAPVGYAVFDQRGRILEVNLTGARLLRRLRSQLSEAPFASFLEQRDMRVFLTHVKRVLDSNSTPAWTETVDLRMRSEMGPRVLRLHSSPREGDSGRACFSAILDVTEHAQAVREQRVSDRLRQAVLDALPAQIAVLDARGDIIAINRAWRCFAEENGAPAEVRDGVGLNYLSICRNVQGEDAAIARRTCEGVASVIAGRVQHFVHEYPCHGPERQRWFAMTAVPLGQDMQGAVVVHFDITERVLAEERTQRARESAAQAARVNAVGILAASLIHELTQPLSAASFLSDAALLMLEDDEAGPAKLADVLTGVDGQIKRAAHILERLREFLRKRSVSPEAVAIDDIVRKSMALVRWFAEDRNVSLHFAQPAPNAIVQADALQVEQVLVNLICNSVQAIDGAKMGRREVSVAIDRAPAHLEVTVRDSGPGVPIEAREQLFDIFASTKHSGLGMGLTISRDIIERHGGKLWADLDAAEGAVFHFTLPLEGRSDQ